MHPFPTTLTNITLRQMRAFAEAYRRRNLTHAAEGLHMTQSAMSALIRQFEEELNVRLFERTSRMLRPTKAADEAYPQVKEMLSKVNALRASMQSRAENLESVLAFCCVPAIASSSVASVLAEFRKEMPEVQVVLHDAADESLVNLVLSEEFEFSISSFTYDSVAITESPLLTDYCCVLCPKASELAKLQHLTWADLRGQPIIALAKSIGTEEHDRIATLMAQGDPHFRPAYNISSIHTALSLVSNGLGVAVMPQYLVKGNPLMSDLVAQKLHEPVIEQPLRILTRQGHTLSTPAQRFLAMMRNRLVATSS